MPRFFHQRNKRVIIDVTTEQHDLSRPSIAHLVNVTASTHTRSSSHGAITVANGLPTVRARSTHNGERSPRPGVRPQLEVRTVQLEVRTVQLGSDPGVGA